MSGDGKTEVPVDPGPSASADGRSCRLKAGEAVLLIDRKSRHYLRVLRRGAKLSVRGGLVDCSQLIGLQEGVAVESSLGEAFRVVRPSYAHLIPCLPRQAQVIYPKDAGQILVWGDIFPGARVVEVGVGPGALTIALLRAVGPEGKVVSYEIREDFCAMARRNIELYCGYSPRWELVNADAREGISEREVDRLVVDMAQPWEVVEPAAAALRPGGVFVSFIPTVLQLKQIVDVLQGHPCFDLIESLETLSRSWQVRGLSVRPAHRMVAHTGFLVIARRIAT